MPPEDISQILSAITNLHSEMASGFKGVHERINDVCDRVKPLEDDKIRRDTGATIEERRMKNQIDWGKWSIRGLVAFLALQLAPNVYAMAKRIILEILGIK